MKNSGFTSWSRFERLLAWVGRTACVVAFGSFLPLALSAGGSDAAGEAQLAIASSYLWAALGAFLGAAILFVSVAWRWRGGTRGTAVVLDLLLATAAAVFVIAPIAYAVYTSSTDAPEQVWPASP